ncbi:ATP-binding cassette domain-containing protein [Nonomuraea phyllanthi]|uniref:ATP-binding cassette domain-containing protein n=1 Tax=Nonomuraea phyllanthi TaxID=2219224 RepID=A0A5C4VGK2_9ACTN|nr:ATP-binding cassette domain-containing protein [Nonomuraea phyllanthi]
MEERQVTVDEGRDVASTTGPAAAVSDKDPADVHISIRGLTKQFDVRGSTVTALDSLDLDIPRGQFLVIVGPSGCGKTTLLRMLAALESPTSGAVEVRHGGEGRPGNSMVFQGDSIFPWMSVWDNAAFGLTMRGVPRAEIRESVGHYLEKTGLSAFADAYPHQLSGGMRQRVSIARAFANDPDVLLMDEPFSALDEQNKTLLQAELLRIWDETRKTVVFITHSVDEAVTLADRIMVMSAQPGQAKAFVDVPFERPRDVLELRHLEEYGDIVYDIWQHLRDEVSRSQRQAAAAPATGRRRRR